MKRKDLEWVGSSKKDLAKCPKDVKGEVGHGLYLAQIGEQSKDAKVLKGFSGASVLEIITIDSSGTYRTVYTVRFKEIVFVLHVFQKKSKHGIATPNADMNLVNSRLKQAEEMYKAIMNKKVKSHEKEK